MSQFLHLKCAGDVLNALGHPVREPEREIVRAMACLRLLRGGVKSPTRYPHTAAPSDWARLSQDHGPKVLAPVRLVELGTYNGTLAILAAHVLPFKEVIVFGEETLAGPRLFDVARLSFRRGNIHAAWIEKHLHDLDTPVVLASSHASPEFADRAIQLFKHVPNVEQLVLLFDNTVAWKGSNGTHSRVLVEQMGKEAAWAVEQALPIHADVFRDNYIPKQFAPRVVLHARARIHRSTIPLSTIPISVEDRAGDALGDR